MDYLILSWVCLVLIVIGAFMSRKKCNSCGYERMVHDVWIEEEGNILGGYTVYMCDSCKRKHDAEIGAENDLPNTDKYTN